VLILGLFLAATACSDRVTVRYTDCVFLRENGQADNDFVSEMTFMVSPKTREVFEVGVTTANLARCGAADYATCLRSCSVADSLHWSCRNKVGGADMVDGRDWLETFNADGNRLIETSEPATLMGHIGYTCSTARVVVAGITMPLFVASML
jgi:hypothetical protein